MLIKICGLKTRADVAAAVGAGADAVGFVFVESPRKVSIEEALAACAELPEHIQRVAVMKQPDQALVDAVIAGFKPDVLQTDAEDFASLKVSPSVRRWPVFRQGVSEPEPVPGNPLSARGAPETKDEPVFLYEGRASGAGQTINWRLAREHAATGQMILAGGLTPENVADAIREAAPWGVDVSSGVESERGKKDHAKIHAFTEAARAATRNS